MFTYETALLGIKREKPAKIITQSMQVVRQKMYSAETSYLLLLRLLGMIFVPRETGQIGGINTNQ